MSRVEIKVAGFGGQGMALLGRIIGIAAEQYTEKTAIFTQTYGPESRGGASSSDVIIENDKIDYPYTTPGNLDYFIVMSKEAYEKFIPYSKKTGSIFYDEDLVELVFSGISNIIDIEAVKKAVLGAVPARFRAINEKAFLEGYNYKSPT